MDDRDDCLWVGSVYYVSPEQAFDHAGYMQELRSNAPARYGPLPSLREQMACTGTGSTDLAGCRLINWVDSLLLM